MGFWEILKFLKDIGLLRVAEGLSFLAWLILPFWIWLIALRFLGNEFFVFYLAVFGVGIFIVELIFVVVQIFFWRGYEFKIMKLIEKAGALFRDPKNKQKVEEFKDECRKFILPFTHHRPFMLSAIAETQVRPHRVIIGRIESFFVSYSIVTLLVIFHRELLGILDSLRPIISQILPPELTDLPFRNLWISLGILWMLSLYYDPFVSLIRNAGRYGVPRGIMISVYFTSLCDLPVRITVSASKLFLIPIILAERRRAVMCDPFIDPLTLPTIVQKAIMNVEGKSCDVSRWDEDIDVESDADRIKELARKDPKVPFMLRFFARITPSKVLLRRIKEAQPITYVGIQNDRCVFLGHVMYDIVRRIRTGRFYFDTTYLKKEFLLIYREEIKKQRRIERKLPVQLEELVKSLG